jgi:D-amino-acid dehydrogenase
MKTVVVGAGVIGLCTAYSLRRRGFDVEVLTTGGVGAGASTGNAGWIAPSLSGPVPGPGVLSGSLRWMLNPASPFYVRPRPSPSFLRWLLAFRSHCNARDYAAGLAAMAALNRRTMELYDGLRANGLVFDEHRAGLVMAFHAQRDFDHDIASTDWFAGFGLPAPVPGRPTRRSGHRWWPHTSCPASGTWIRARWSARSPAG